MHWNDNAATVSQTVVNSVTTPLTIKHKTKALNNGNKTFGFDDRQVAHTATSIGLINKSSLGMASPCAVRLSK